MVGHGPRTHAARAGLPRRPSKRCAAAMRPWARFSLLEELGRTEEDLADAPDGDRAAGDFRHAGGARGALEIVGRRSRPPSSATASAKSRRPASPACSASKKARGSSCCARVSWTSARAAKERCSPSGLGEEEARALIARHDRTVTIAAFNGPRSLTLSGARDFARGDARRTGAAGRLRAARPGRSSVSSSA